MWWSRRRQPRGRDPSSGACLASHFDQPVSVAATAEAGFVESWKKTAAVFAGKPGYLDTQLHKSLDPHARFRFVNVAHWESAEAWVEAMKAFPPAEAGTEGVEANPAL